MSDTVDIQPTASATTPLEQNAAHAANPLANPPATIASRLPAGSTLEVVPGLHVPHPHAEVNLPGKGDPRLGDTNAVTEFVKTETVMVDKETDEKQIAVLTSSVEQTPLAEDVKPRTLVVTTDPDHEAGTPAVVQLQKK